MNVKSYLFLLLLCSTFRLSAADPPPVICAVQQFTLLEGMRTSPTTVRFPFRLVGRLMVVRAAVNGEAGYFVVDTGSDKLVLNAKHYKGVTYNAKLAAVSVTGELGDVRKTKVDSLNWDQLVFEDFFADVVDLSHIEQNKHIKIMGLLGYDVLKEYEVLLDYQKKQVVLSLTNEDGELLDPNPYFEQATDSLDFKMRNEMVVLRAQIGEDEMDFVLDSGAELNLLDRYTKKRILKHFDIVKRVKLVGVENKKVEVLAGQLNGVQFGNIACESMRTLLTNLSDMNRSYGFQIKGLVGYEFLGTRRTIINYKKQKLYFLAWKKS